MFASHFAHDKRGASRFCAHAVHAFGPLSNENGWERGVAGMERKRERERVEWLEATRERSKQKSGERERGCVRCAAQPLLLLVLAASEAPERRQRFAELVPGQVEESKSEDSSKCKKKGSPPPRAHATCRMTLEASSGATVSRERGRLFQQPVGAREPSPKAKKKERQI